MQSKTALLVALFASWGTSSRAGPSTDEIIAKTIIKMVQDSVNKRQLLTFYRKETDQELSEKEEVQQTTTSLYFMYGHDGKLYKLLIEQNGKPVQSQSDTSDDIVDETFFDRYNFWWHQADTYVSGRLCHLINFGPKDKSPHNKSDKDKVFNKLVGTMYIDTENFSLWRIEGMLSEQISIGFMGLGKVYRFDVVIDQQEVNSIMVKRSIVTVDHYKKPLTDKFERHVVEYFNYSYR